MIVGNKTILNPVIRQHRAKLFYWRNDRALLRLTGEYQPISEAAHDQWMDSVVKRADMFIFVILERGENRPIGYCFLSNVSPVHRNAKLGIAIGEADHRDKGYGSDALRGLVDFGFRDLNLERIWLDVFTDNARAIHVYEKLGFCHEGSLRRHYFVEGRYRDALVMGLLRHERPDDASTHAARPGAASR